jgi:hypothetical protein
LIWGEGGFKNQRGIAGWQDDLLSEDVNEVYPVKGKEMSGW